MVTEILFRILEYIKTINISPEILLEIFGYIGTILVVVSMMMTSVTKLRIVNMCGSVISAIYAGICGTWPIVVMNISLFIINGFHLIKGYFEMKKRVT